VCRLSDMPNVSLVQFQKKSFKAQSKDALDLNTVGMAFTQKVALQP